MTPFPEAAIISGSITEGSCITATFAEGGDILSLVLWERRPDNTWTICRGEEAICCLDEDAIAKLQAIIATQSPPSRAFGREAEELRRGIEKLIADTDIGGADEAAELVGLLRALLDEVDARDSLAFVERRAAVIPYLHAPICDPGLTRIIGCRCGRFTASTQESDAEYILHVALNHPTGITRAIRALLSLHAQKASP